MRSFAHFKSLPRGSFVFLSAPVCLVGGRTAPESRPVGGWVLRVACCCVWASLWWSDGVGSDRCLDLKRALVALWRRHLKISPIPSNSFP
jgi:hypothetical protein